MRRVFRGGILGGGPLASSLRSKATRSKKSATKSGFGALHFHSALSSSDALQTLKLLAPIGMAVTSSASIVAEPSGMEPGAASAMLLLGRVFGLQLKLEGGVLSVSDRKKAAWGEGAHSSSNNKVKSSVVISVNGTPLLNPAAQLPLLARGAVLRAAQDGQNAVLTLGLECEVGVNHRLASEVVAGGVVQGETSRAAAAIWDSAIPPTMSQTNQEGPLPAVPRSLSRPLRTHYRDGHRARAALLTHPLLGASSSDALRTASAGSILVRSVDTLRMSFLVAYQSVTRPTEHFVYDSITGQVVLPSTFLEKVYDAAELKDKRTLAKLFEERRETIEVPRPAAAAADGTTRVVHGVRAKVLLHNAHHLIFKLSDKSTQSDESKSSVKDSAETSPPATTSLSRTTPAAILEHSHNHLVVRRRDENTDWGIAMTSQKDGSPPCIAHIFANRVRTPLEFALFLSDANPEVVACNGVKVKPGKSFSLLHAVPSGLTARLDFSTPTLDSQDQSEAPGFSSQVNREKQPKPESPTTVNESDTRSSTENGEEGKTASAPRTQRQHNETTGGKKEGEPPLTVTEEFVGNSRHTLRVVLERKSLDVEWGISMEATTLRWRSLSSGSSNLNNRLRSAVWVLHSVNDKQTTDMPKPELKKILSSGTRHVCILNLLSK